MLAFRFGRAERETRFVRRIEAEALMQDMSRRCQRLEIELTRLRAAAAGT